MTQKEDSTISRREFAVRTAMASVAATVAPTIALPLDSHAETPVPQPPQQPSASSSPNQEEAEARIQTIFALYGSRFSEEQKADLRRLCAQAQQALNRLRIYPTENGDGTALYLKPLMERERAPGMAPKPIDSGALKRKS